MSEKVRDDYEGADRSLRLSVHGDFVKYKTGDFKVVCSSVINKK